MIEIENVSKAFNKVPALVNIHLEIERGHTTVLIGTSGSGKSTLIRLIMGLISPDAGVIKINGVILSAATVLALRDEMGYVIQEGGLFPHLSAKENVIIKARYCGWPVAQIEQRVREL